MVVLSLEAYSQLANSVEKALDYADRVAEESTYRVTHTEGFENLRRRLHE